MNLHIRYTDKVEGESFARADIEVYDSGWSPPATNPGEYSSNTYATGAQALNDLSYDLYVQIGEEYADWAVSDGLLSGGLLGGGLNGPRDDL